MKTIQFTLSTLTFLLLLNSGFVNGQEDVPHRKEMREDKIEQMKIAFFTKELNMTSAEAEKFWPVYHEMDNKLKAEKKIQRQHGMELNTNVETMSDADIKKKTSAIFDSEMKEAEIKKEYTDKIAGVLGYKKAAKLLSLERRFKQELLKKLNDSPKQGPPRGPGSGKHRPMR